MKSFYFESFPTFWNNFNHLIDIGEIYSTREVYKELERKDNIFHEINYWIKNCNINKELFFSIPTQAELTELSRIFEIEHFHQCLNQRNIISGAPCADPFIIAKAMHLNAIVITEEKNKDHSAKIPTICTHFKINYLSLREFISKQNWIF
jgi:hypothetical protein